MREIEYRSQNLRETLVELKDSSELAVDLAYSAVLFDNRELAEAVLDLASRANYLRYHARIALMLGAKNVSDAESFVGLFQVVDGAVDITEAAADIARIPLRDFGIPPEFRALPDAHEQFVRVTVTDGSALVNRSLGDLELDVEEGVNVIAIQRADGWDFDPAGEDRIRAGDVVYGRGPEEGVADLYERATGTPYEPPTHEPGDEAIARAVETVVELKNVSELGIGLSYSAALYDSDELAEQVQDLEIRSDELREELETWVVTAAEGTSADGHRLRGLFHLAVAAEVISDAALDVAEVVFRDVELPPVFGRAIGESKEVVTSVEIAPGSALVGQTISEFEHETEVGMTVLARRRDGTWTYDPPDDGQIEGGDRLVLKGPSRGEERVRHLATNG